MSDWACFLRAAHLCPEDLPSPPMLNHISIQNFAIIESEEVQLSGGFTVLTGETGAGKSIILDAITLLLGGRASADMVRRGQERASVEGTFTLSGEDREVIEERLRALSIHPRLDGQLTITRAVSVSGKNKAQVNGQEARVADLRGLTEGLVEIVRQHESYTLLDPESHLGLLDDFGGLTGEALAVSDLVEKGAALERERKHLEASESQRRERLRQLKAQLEQIERLAPEPSEDERLEREIRLLHAAERLKGWVDEGLNDLYSRDGAVLDTLASLSRGLERLTEVDERLQGFYEALGRAQLELEELTHDLRRFRGEIPTDADALSSLEARLAALEQLKSDYGLSLEGILGVAEEARRERAALRALDARVSEAAREAREALARAEEAARALSARRAALAPRLSALVEGELKTLGMAQCRLSVDFGGAPLSRSGLDRAEFLISPNPGEGFKPLARIASGGELSRLTLALKVVLMHTDATPTYVFDEVDSGIGGGVAEGVGQKLKRIALDRQVVCITHLPQVASCAHNHMRIEKVLLQDRTFSSIRALSEEEREGELARMLGGQDMTEATFAHAREMISRGRRPVSPAEGAGRPRRSEVIARAARPAPDPRARPSAAALNPSPPAEPPEP
jgi:DNA repair protein RecN (Recombination protein N)